MINILIVLITVFITSCSVAHNHYHVKDEYINNKIVNHSFIDRGDHIIVIVKHRYKLKKYQKKRLKYWFNKHYKHHRKYIKYKFILG